MRGSTRSLSALQAPLLRETRGWSRPKVKLCSLCQWMRARDPSVKSARTRPRQCVCLGYVPSHKGFDYGRKCDRQIERYVTWLRCGKGSSWSDILLTAQEVPQVYARRVNS
jgi:hypothetical protein